MPTVAGLCIITHVRYVCIEVGFAQQNAKGMSWVERKEVKRKRKRSDAQKERDRKARDNRSTELNAALSQQGFRLEDARGGDKTAPLIFRYLCFFYELHQLLQTDRFIKPLWFLL
jgi:hypothetical protein